MNADFVLTDRNEHTSVRFPLNIYRNAAMRMIKKISTKTVVGNINAKMLPEDDSTMELYQVIGIASAVQGGESNYGAWQCLSGRFRAVNLETGDGVESGRAFLPTIAHNLVAPKIVDGAHVEFALIIGARRSEYSPAGYEYVAEPIFVSEADPMNQLAKRVEAARRVEAPRGVIGGEFITRVSGTRS